MGMVQGGGGMVGGWEGGHGMAGGGYICLGCGWVLTGLESWGFEGARGLRGEKGGDV